MFDAATSSVAVNKIRIAARLGAEIPGGWLAAEDGSPIMEPSIAPDIVTLLPLGADREGGSHKGYGLSCMVDILSGVLSGFGYGVAPGSPNFGHMDAA